MMYAIRVENLYKSYNEHQVLKGISFNINKGEIFALLGMNGAGKTTILECIEGLLKIDKGKIVIHGTCGVQLQNSSLPKTMKVMEALQYFAKWANTKIDKTLLEHFGIHLFQNKQYQQLSTGQKRKLHLAISLLNNPDILILDEPTSGLDVEGRILMHQEIIKLKALNKTIILATHDLQEVKELCDRVAIIKDGEISFLDTCDKLTTIHHQYQLSIQFSVPPILENIQYQDQQNAYVFTTSNIEDTLQIILEQVYAQNISITNIQLESDIQKRFLDFAKGD